MPSAVYGLGRARSRPRRRREHDPRRLDRSLRLLEARHACRLTPQVARPDDSVRITTWKRRSSRSGPTRARSSSSERPAAAVSARGSGRHGVTTSAIVRMQPAEIEQRGRRRVGEPSCVSPFGQPIARHVARRETASSTSSTVRPCQSPTSISRRASRTRPSPSSSATIRAVSLARRSGLVYTAARRSSRSVRAPEPGGAPPRSAGVGVALEAVLAIPVGLAVPDENDRRRHAG